MQPERTLRVYTDGQCRFCLWARGLIEPHDTGHLLEFRDYNDPLVAQEAPFTSAELSREMHVRTREGVWCAGYRAWIAVLGALPRWHWLARLAALPPLVWFGPSLYRRLAANRYRIARWLPATGSPTQCDHCHVPSAGKS
jgi:predicted DCC family thiol-disulfide oxidoreductase YuxK